MIPEQENNIFDSKNEIDSSQITFAESVSYVNIKAPFLSYISFASPLFAGIGKNQQVHCKPLVCMML